ncbi:Fanconi anemia group B protein [Danio aesculapii]|uniref:Fanconi anemia group B protein n=1 Tax=Danio aesculapii TaxID=1142201 RepID=UPI0024C0B661|nr:Fanconi anemia group B protein [Danio aesculapii]
MAAERQIKMLAFGGDVLVFQSKALSTKARGSEVSFCRFSFNQDSQTFSITERDSIHKDNSAEIEIIHCCAALDQHKRQKVPCVLLRLCKKRASAFKYLLYSICTDVKLHAEFVLMHQIRDGISILQGPTLIWRHDNLVYCASLKDGGVKEVQIPLTVKFMHELPRKIAPSKVHNMLHFIEDAQILDAACLVADAYRSVLQCMMVLSAEDVHGVLKSAVLAATSMKQLVYFEDGLPRDVCVLPYERPMDIQILHTLKNECLIALSFDQGHVCAVWKNTFQVVCCWSAVHLLLVEDFLRCGSDQMLLLFEDCSSSEQINTFLLTDLCGVTHSRGRSDGEVSSTSDAVQENHLLTVQALDSRLQSGLLYLEELQRDVQVKDRLVQQTLSALADLLSGKHHLTPPPEQEGLVSLWDDDDDDGDDAGVVDEVMQTEDAEALLKVGRVWQRVIGQSLIIGVLLMPTNDMSVMDMGVSVVLDGDQSSASPVLNSRTMILPYPSSESEWSLGPSAVKRIRRSDRSVSTLALLSVTDAAPLLTSGSVRFPIMLHYSRHSSGSPAESVRLSQHCGQISLRLKDVADGKFHPRLLQDSKLNTEEAREDLLSLKALLEVWCLLIRCSDHTLADVQLWLQQSLGLQRLTVDPHFTVDPSGVMLFHWEQRSPFQAVLSIYCRDDLPVLHFLQALCDFLPASHDVRLLKSSVRSAGGLAESLQTEIHAVNQGVASVLQRPKEEELNAQGEESGEESQATIESQRLHRLREAWLRDRGRSFDRLHPLLDCTQYSRLTEQLIHTQMKTDEEALMEVANESLKWSI